MHGMYIMFPTSAVDSKDPISKKKMRKKDGQWRVEKGILGWNFEGVEKIRVLEDKKIEAILVTLKEWSQSKRGIPFSEFHATFSKVQHASKGMIPALKVLCVINLVLGIMPEPKTVLIRKNSELAKSIAGFLIPLCRKHYDVKQRQCQKGWG